MVTEHSQQPGGGGFAHAGNGFEQLPPPLQIGMVIEVLMDFLAGSLEFLFQKGEYRLNRAGRGGIGGLQAILFHALHFQELFEPAQQRLQLADFRRGWRPEGRLHRPRLASDEFGIGLTGFGPAP